MIVKKRSERVTVAVERPTVIERQYTNESSLMAPPPSTTERRHEHQLSPSVPPSSVGQAAPVSPVAGKMPELPGACVMPLLAVDPATGLDPVLYKGQVSPSKILFQRKPPHLDRQREYESNGNSHQAARSTVAMLSDRHRDRQIEKEEAFLRDNNLAKFQTKYVETRLATNGEPTLNTMDVRIARERDAAAATSKSKSPGKKVQHKGDTNDRICQAIRLAYGSHVLDLKALELVHIPRQVFSTLLLQLGRFMTQVNVSRNALREIPDTFVMAFPQVATLNYKENALDQLPLAMSKLTSLTELNAECNQLRVLPTHLPSTLQKLVLSRNRLTSVPHLHELTQLMELDLSHNHIQLLPPGMAFLGRLTKLVLNGNRLVSLALVPKFLIQTDHVKAKEEEEEDGDEGGGGGEGGALWSQEKISTEQNKWRVESDPLTGDSVYFHIASKRVTRVKPRCFRSNVPLLAIGKTTAVVNKRKTHAQWLAVFPDGWEITLGGVCINRTGGSRRPTTTTSSSTTPSRPDTSVSVPGSAGAGVGVGAGRSDLQSMQLSFIHHLTDPENPFTSTDSIPPALDKWHELHRIQSLHLSGNQLVDLPLSIGKLVRLKHLDVENNKLQSLPDVFHEMHALETVKLAMNALSWLPPSFCALPNLTDLDLKLNRFQSLPDEIGSLMKLRCLDLSSNSLEKLSQGLLSLKKLTILKLQGNEKLVTSGLLHAETLASGDIARVFWHLQHQLLIDVDHHGARPPSTLSQGVGVGSEDVWSTNHHIHRAFSQAIQVAQQTKVLDFHWKHLVVTQFPKAFFETLQELRELRLSGQKLESIPCAFGSVCSQLRVLQLRKNQIRVLEDGVFDIVGLTTTGLPLPLEELDLENNQLETFPLSIGKLTSLKVLRAANNRLEHDHFPETFAMLCSLQELDLSHNKLTQPPHIFSELVALKKLDLSYNQLETLSSMRFTKLQKLVDLRLNVNRLIDLPEQLSVAPIQTLCVAGNQLTALPATILLLQKTLGVLRIQSNKISRLPVEFGQLHTLETVQADGNPFLSPPPEIMNLGIHQIRKYLVKRQQRVHEMTRLLQTMQFPFQEDRFAKPQLTKLLDRQIPPVETMKFLTEKHLVQFERKVDSYINGPFYLLPPDIRGADLVTELLLQKQFLLAQRHREKVLRDLVKLLALIRGKKWLDKVDFRYDLQRPWGRLGEDCAIYVVNPRVLFDDKPELPSVMSVIKKRVYHGFEEEAFEHSEQDVVDALEHYIGVYGPVGIAHEDVPFKCGCEELLRYNKRHEPCYRTGWSILQVVYTEEEAARRVSEEQSIQEALAALRPQIETFLQTKEGEKRFHKEVVQIKNRLRKELKMKKSKLKKLQAKLDTINKEMAHEKKNLEKQNKQNAKSGKKQKHIIHKTLADANDEKEQEEKRIQMGERVKEWTNEYEKGKTQLGQGYHAFMGDVVAILMEKVGVEVRNHLVKQHRQRAIEFGLRRPWDGPNGRDFEAYTQLVRRKMLSDGTMESEDPPATVVAAGAKGGGGKEPPAGGKQRGKKEEKQDAESDNSEISDVSFDGYEDLVSNLTGKTEAEGHDEDEDEGDEDEDEEENEQDTAAKAAAMATLEVSDVSDDDGDGGDGDNSEADARESEDSEL